MERNIRLHTSRRVYDQAKHWRPLFRRELLEAGLSIGTVERMLQACERKFKDFITDEKMVIHGDLSRSKYSKVSAFFEKHKANPEMVALGERKKMTRKHSTGSMPEKSDMVILGEALSLPNLFFTTTDGHYKVLSTEIENEFGITLIHDGNALRRMRGWGWI